MICIWVMRMQFKERPFLSVVEMNGALIHNINEVVGKEDELWILGDFSYRVNKEQVCQLRNQIICRHVHLIYGKHYKYSSDHFFNLFNSIKS